MAKIHVWLITAVLLLPFICALEGDHVRRHLSTNGVLPNGAPGSGSDKNREESTPDGVLSFIGGKVYSAFSGLINFVTPVSVSESESSEESTQGPSSVPPLTGGCYSPDGRSCRNTKRVQRQLSRNEMMSEKSASNSYPKSVFEQDLLKYHNKLRSHYDLNSLIWNDTLRSGVANYLNRQQKQGCRMAHSSHNQRTEVGMFFHVGENLYTSWGPSSDKQPAGWHVAKAWFNEVACYRYGPQGDPCTKSYTTPNCLQSNRFTPSTVKVGHFTQMMWQSATHIGCYVTMCNQTANKKRYLAGCWYGSTIDDYGGNVKGAVPFERAIAKKLRLPLCV
eukprot:Lankesteria_metandrocarpae@DN7066_c0_g1_i1.p1